MNFPFRPNPTGQRPAGESVAEEVTPSAESGVFSAKLGTPTWRKFVANKAFQDANRGAIAAENDYEARIARENAAAARPAPAAAASPAEKIEAKDGRLFRKVGTAAEELDPESLADDPVIGPHARRALFDRERQKTAREADEMDFRLRDPSVRVNQLSPKERQDAETELGVVGDVPEYAAQAEQIRQRLRKDDEVRKMEQSAYNARARARSLEAADPEQWWQSRTPQQGPTVQDARALQQSADVADESAAREMREIQQALQVDGVSGDKLDAAKARLAELADARKVIADTRREGDEQVAGVQERARTVASQGVVAARAEILSSLERLKVFPAFTAAMTVAKDKQLEKRDGKWVVPQMGRTADDDANPAMKMMAGLSGAAQSGMSRLGLQSDSMDLELKRVQKSLGLSDDEMKTAWRDLSTQYRKWEDGEVVRVQSNGDLVPNPTASEWLDSAKAARIIEQSGGSEASKQALTKNLAAMQAEIAAMKLEAYTAAGELQRPSRLAVGPSDLVKFKAPDDWAKENNRKDIGTPQFILDYERAEVNSKPWLIQKVGGLIVDTQQGNMKLASTLAGFAGALGSESAGALGAEVTDASGMAERGQYSTGLVGKVIEELPSLATQMGVGRAAAVLGKAITGSVKGARIAGVTASVSAAGAQSMGATFASEIAAGKSEEEARENAVMSGINTALITGIFQVGGLGGVESIAAGRSAASLTLADVMAATTKAELARNVRRFAGQVLKSAAGEAAEEGIDELTQAFITADPSSNLSDAWSNALEAAKVGGFIGGSVDVASKVAGGRTPTAPPAPTVAPVNDRVAAAVAAQAPDAPPPTQEEIRAAYSILPEDSGAMDVAEAVLIERELAEVKASEEAAMAAAEQAVTDAKASGDTVATAAAEAELEKLKTAGPAAPRVRAVLKIAGGQAVADLTDAEAASLGITPEGKPLPAAGLKAVGLTKPLIRGGVDGSPVLLDEALALVEKTSPLARSRVKLSEAEAFAKSKERAEAAQQEWEVGMADGTKARVRGADPDTAEQEAAVTGRIVPGTAKKIGATPPAAAPPAPTGTPPPASAPPAPKAGDDQDKRAAREGVLPPPPGKSDAERKAWVDLKIFERDLERDLQAKMAPVIAASYRRIEKVRKATKIPIVESKKPDVRASAFDEGILVNVENIARIAIRSGMRPGRASRYFSRVLDEEIRHFAHLLSSRRLYEESGSDLDFETWRQAYYGKLWQTEFVATGKDKIVRNLYAVDATSEASLAVFDAKAPWQKFMEGARFTSQAKSSTVTEEGKMLWADITAKLRKVLQAALEELRSLILDLDSFPALKAEITNLENALREITRTPDSGNRPNKPPAVPKSDGARPAAKRPGNQPPSGGRDQAGAGAGTGPVTVAVGTRVEFTRNGKRLTGVVDLMRGDLLRVRLDVPDSEGVPTRMALVGDVSVLTSASVASPDSSVAKPEVGQPEAEATPETPRASRLHDAMSPGFKWTGKTGIEWARQLDQMLATKESGERFPTMRFLSLWNNGMNLPLVKAFFKEAGIPSVKGWSQSGIKEALENWATTADQAPAIPEESRDTQWEVENMEVLSKHRIKIVDELAQNPAVKNAITNTPQNAAVEVQAQIKRMLAKMVNQNTVGPRVYEYFTRLSANIQWIDGVVRDVTTKVAPAEKTPTKGERPFTLDDIEKRVWAKPGSGWPEGTSGKIISTPDWIDGKWVMRIRPDGGGQITVTASEFQLANPGAAKKQIEKADEEVAKANAAATSVDPALEAAPEDTPVISEADQALLDAMEGLFAGDLPETFTAEIPRDRMGALVNVATKYLDEGVSTPEALAERLSTLADGRLRQFSQSIWFGFKMVGTPGAAEPDWSSIYESLNRPAQEEAAPSNEDAAMGVRSMQLAEVVAERIRRKEKTSIQQLTDLAAGIFGGRTGENFDIKTAYDAVEMAINLLVMDSKIEVNVSAEKALENIAKIREWLEYIPTQTRRTGEMDQLQQFSTPPHFAYAAAWAAAIRTSDVGLEPSSGLGGLAAWMERGGASVQLNELSDRRREMLDALRIGPPATGHDAGLLHAILLPDINSGKISQPTVVVMNPPFSNNAAGRKDLLTGAKHIDEALKLLPPGGRLVAIVGEGMAFDAPTYRSWWDSIRKKYSIRANIRVDGREYRKYGTTFSNRILIIDKSPPLGDVAVGGEVETIEELIPLLDQVRQTRPQSNESGVSSDSQASDQQSGNAPDEEGANDAGVIPGSSDSGAGTAGSDQGGAGGKRTGTRAGGGRGSRNGGNNRAPGPVTDTAANLGEPADGSSGVDSVGTPTIENSEVERDTQDPDADREIDGKNVFANYQPTFFRLKGSVKHPTTLVESSVMATTQLPKSTVTLNLPQETVTSGALSDAQLEAIAYAAQAHETVFENGDRQGFFIGDGTGVGKGREIAGTILHNFREGRRKAVWISEKEGLSKDARRDLDGIGGKEIAVHEMVKKITPPPGDGVAFLTYDGLKNGFNGIDSEGKIRTNGNKASRIKTLLDWLGADFDGVIALDEVHNAGNVIPIKGTRGYTQPSKKALAVVDLQNVFPKARILYVSATGATEPNNLAFASRLGLWGVGKAFDSAVKFYTEIKSAGLSAMEIVARDLKAMGLYMARTLSFQGIDGGEPVGFDRLEHQLTADQEEIYRKAAEGWQTIFTNLDLALDATGAGRSATARSAASSAFWGSQQRFFNGLLTAMQMPSALQDIRKRLDEGGSIVIQLINTNEAALDRAIDRALQENPENPDYESVDLSSRQDILDYIFNSFPVQQFHEVSDGEYADGTPKTTWVPLNVTDADGNVTPVLNPEAVAARDQLLEEIATLALPDPPLEQLFNAFGEEAVAEITGRSRRLIRRTDDQGVTRRVLETGRGKPKVQKDKNDFLDGKRRILVFSDAGGTGFSYHAGANFKNQQKRFQYVVQAGWRADKAIQGLGRTHRADQVKTPHFILVSTNVSGHKRFISTIARRLQQLGALTSGERKTTGQGLFNDDDNLEDSYAELAVRRFFNDLFRGAVAGMNFQDVSNRLGYVKTVRGEPVNTLVSEDGSLNSEKIPPLKQFLNRILAMPIAEQNATFDAFITRRAAFVEQARESGSYDSGVETFVADDLKINRDETVFEDPNSSASTRLVEVGYKRYFDYNTFDFVASFASNPKWVVSRDGKRIYALGDTDLTITQEDGRVLPAYRRYGLKSATTEAKEKYVTGKRPGFAKVGDEFTDGIQKWRLESIEAGDNPQAKIARVPNDGMTLPESMSAVNARASHLEALFRQTGNMVEGVNENSRYLPEYYELTPAEAKEEWNRLLADEPKFEERSSTFIVGSTLPVWHRIPFYFKQVKRVTTEDGKSFLGVIVPDDKIDQTRNQLGAAAAGVTPSRVIDAIINRKAQVELSNGWVMKFTKSAGEDRIELVGPDQDWSTGTYPRWQSYGFIERINFRPRFFIAPEIKAIDRLLRYAPGMRIIEAQSGLQASDLPPPTSNIRTDSPEWKAMSKDERRAYLESRKGLEAGDLPAPFYSALQRAVQAKIPARATPEQIMATVRAAGVKAEEIKWSGIEQALPSLAVDGKVSKDALLKYLREEGSVRLEEVTLGKTLPSQESTWQRIRDAGYDVQEDGYGEVMDRETGEDVAFRDLPASVQRDVQALRADEDNGNDVANSTKYSKYVLPGGENYREVVLAMPNTKLTKKQFLEANGITEDRWNAMDATEKFYWDGRHYTEHTTAGYTSTHFPDVPNYVAHMRTNERDGGLFIEEIQSDRHQAGRKKGYTRLEDNKSWRAVAKSGAMGPAMDSEAEAQAWINSRIAEKDRALWEVDFAAKTIEGIAPAPFQTTWPLAMFKRALRDAVASGKEWIGWTDGKTQNERFKLSTRIEAIRARKDGDKWTLEVKPKNADVSAVIVAEDALPEHVGKDFAQKIIDDGGGTYTGLDLDVGGDGMKGFYDNMLPKEIGKYVKQWGGRVEKGKIEEATDTKIRQRADDQWAVVSLAGEQISVHETENEAIESAKIYYSIWRVDITPQMKESILQGQALFAGDLPSPADETAANIEALRIDANKRVPRPFVEELRAQQSEFGRGAVGVPRLANPGDTARSRDEQSIAQLIYEHNRERREDRSVIAEARRRLAEDPAGVEEKILQAAFGGMFATDDADHVAARLLINQRAKEAGNDLAKHEANMGLRMAYQLMRAETARQLRIGHDLYQTPAERHREMIADAIYTPSLKVQKKARESNWSPERRREFIRQESAKRIKRINDAMKKMGVTMDEILSGEAYLSLSQDTILKNALRQRSAEEQLVIKLHQRNYSMARIKKNTGLSDSRIQEIVEKMYDEMLEKAREKVRAGMTLENYRDRPRGLQAGNLPGDLTPEQEAEARRIVEIGFGLRREVPTVTTRTRRAPAPEESENARMQRVATRLIGKFAESQSDTLRWRPKSERSTNDLVALVNRHIKVGVENFREQAVAIGATEDQARILDLEGRDERRRIAAIKDARARAKAEVDAGDTARRWINRFAESQSDTLAWKPAAKRNANELADLLRKHLKSPVEDFRARAVALGATEDQARILDLEIGEERRRVAAIKEAKKQDKVTNPLTANWTRPIFTDGLNSYSFDSKDRAELMARVAAIRGIAGATGKIKDLSGKKREEALKLLEELNAVLARYGTDAEGIFRSGKPAEDYRFDINDRYHVAAVARAISAIDADIVDKTVEMIYSNILSGLKTMIVNATGGVAGLYETAVSRQFEAAINALFNDPMAASFAESKYILKAVGPIWARSWTNAVATWGSELPMFDEDFLGQPADLGKLFDGTAPRIGSIGGRKGRLIRIPTRLLLATDEFNRTALASLEVGAMAYRTGLELGLKPGTREFDRHLRIEVNTPGSFSSKLAAQKASRMIFTNPLPGQRDPVTGKIVPTEGIGDAIGEIAGKLNELLTKDRDNLFTKAAFAAARVLFIPFQRTPFNILRKGARFTLNPISLIDIGLLFAQNNLTLDEGKLRWTWNSEGRNAELIERTAQQLQGGLLMLLIAAFARGEGDEDDLDKLFVITGSQPYNPRKRGLMDARARAGVGPYRISFRSKDGNERWGFNYGRIEPLGTTLGMTVDSIRMMKRGWDGSNPILSVIGGMVAQTQEKTYLSGLSDMFRLGIDMVADEDFQSNKQLARFAAGRMAMLLPNFIRQPVRETDPYFRERADSFTQEFMYQMWPHGQKAPKRDLYGEAIEKTGTMLSRPVDIFSIGNNPVNPVDEMLLRFAAANPDKAWFPQPLTSSTYRDRRTGETVKMTAEQLDRFKEMTGKRFKALTQRAVLNTKNPTERDIETAKTLLTRARADAKKIIEIKPN